MKHNNTKLNYIRPYCKTTTVCSDGPSNHLMASSGTPSTSIINAYPQAEGVEPGEALGKSMTSVWDE